MLVSLAFSLGLLLASVRAQGDSDKSRPVYKDPRAPIERRVEDLLGRMTIEEKTSQLVQGDVRNWLNVTDYTFNQTGLAWSTAKRGGSFYVGLPIPWDVLSKNIKVAQDHILDNTTLGIPAWVQSEGIHGFLVQNATIFNSPIAYSCSWNTALVQKMAEVIGEEALALGVNNLFAPVVDLARELRFGRVEETFGEDSYLSGEYGYSFVKGLQSKGVSAMVKHFVGFASPEQGLNTGPVHGGLRELHTTYLPAFKRSIIDAGAVSVMSAYHAYDGIPAVADKYTLTEVLRKAWGYKYYVMSDAGGTDRLCNAFYMCRSNPIDSEAVVNYALPAGNDVEMGGGSYNFEKIPELVKARKLSIDVVDEAVRRQLRAKFTLGLFENPFPGVPASEFKKHINTPAAVKLARDLDAESIVLLENHNNVLPLKKTANVAVIGPMAHGPVNYGDYVPYLAQYRGVTPYDGIKAASSGKVTYVKGAERSSNDKSGFQDAIAAAQAADVAVVVVGTWSRDQNELWSGLNATTGEHVDVHNLNLVGAQRDLVKAIIDTGRPTVVVFSSGKPITEPWIGQEAAALVQQFYGSEQGGNALADVLFGDVNPSGKLSVAFPRDIGTAPAYYDYLNSGRPASDPGRVYANGTIKFGHTYVLESPRPLYEFGYGKSYSSFDYKNLRLSKTTASVKDSVTVSVDVTNNSTRDGLEVVQLYVKDLIASVTVPNIQLKGFAKVSIKAGKTETVKINLDVQDIGLWNLDMKYVVEPGNFTVFTAASSLDLRLNATLTVA